MFSKKPIWDSLEQIRQYEERIILECPTSIHGIEFDKPRQANFERTVVASDFWGESLPQGTILVQHQCWFRPVITPVKSHLVLAQVAGYRNAIYGLPEICYPILFEHPQNPNILITSTSFSNFIEGRFAPKDDWKIIFTLLTCWLKDATNAEIIDLIPSVRPAFSAKAVLPENTEENSLTRNIEWFKNHMVFEHEGRMGVFEGYASGIKPNGIQYLRPKTRGDCSGETTMIFALDWAIHRDYSSKNAALRIMDTLFSGPELADNDPQSPTYGSLRFYEYISTYYNEGRAPLACILASELTSNYDYARNILRNLLSMLRTTGPQGFRRGPLKNPESFTEGKTWNYYRNTDFVEYIPHYQAYLWAAFLQAYVLTGHRDFFDKAKTAIGMTMQRFPNLSWTNGISQEYARLLLPLAFLIQIENTPEHHHWLQAVAQMLISDMDDCGAIRERMGDVEYGKYPAPDSNEKFGKSEAPLIQQNGDPACDLLYTMNYAFLGLHEAFVATGMDYYREAVDSIADFLCRIQIISKSQPYLDGCWMRGFDFHLWEYYGSSADSDWGPWCVESGWTNTWISSTLGLRHLNRGLLCREQANKYSQHMPTLLDELSI